MKRRDFLKGALIGTSLLSSGLFPGSGRATEFGKRKHGKDFYRIDSYCHFSTLDYLTLLEQLNAPIPPPNPFRGIFAPVPAMTDVNARLTMMDDCGIDLSILFPLPHLESAPNVYKDTAKSLQAAQFINNALLDIVAQHPTRFQWVALLPTNDVNNMLTEFERAVALGAVGGAFFVGPTMKPPDHPDYIQLYDKAGDLNVPLWIHPGRPAPYPDYLGEPISKYYLFLILGWILDSSVAMSRIVFAGVFNDHPDLKIIIHHRGGLIPFFQNRMQGSWDFYDEIGVPTGIPATISKPYIEHFTKFYVDTVCSGPETELVKVAYDFFGPDHILFGTDAPLSLNNGKDATLNARYSVEKLQVTNKDLQNVFANNILKIIPH